MQFGKKLLPLLGALGLSVTLTTATAQDSWPERPVKIISPYGAGGPNDLSARLLGEHLSAKLGQPFVIENKAGAGTIVGNTYVARTAPDGYHILYAAAPYATVEALNDTLNYDPRTDLTPVSMAATVPLFLIVNADSPYETVDDLISHGKSKSNGLTIGSPGHGSLPHLAAELLLRDAGTGGLVVHYQGDVNAYTDLIAGRLDATLTAITAARPHIDAGTLRVLGVASETPSDIYPDAVPLKDQGLPNVIASAWFGFLVPAGTPEPVVHQLEEEITSALNDPSIRQRLQAMGMDAQPRSHTEFADFIESEMQKWSEVIEHAGLKAD